MSCVHQSPVQSIPRPEKEEDCSFPTKQKAGEMTQKVRRVEGQTVLGEVSEEPPKAPS